MKKTILCTSTDNLSDYLPEVQFTALTDLRLVISMKAYTPKQTELRDWNITEQEQILAFFNRIHSIFPVLIYLDIVVAKKNTIHFVQQLVSRSVLQTANSDKIKYEVFELDQGIQDRARSL